jgi:hypothetical protein
MTDLIPCSIVSSSTMHQQLLFAFVSIEKYFHLSKVQQQPAELSSSTKGSLTVLATVAKRTHYHTYHLAAVTLLKDKEVVASILKQHINPEIYQAVLDVVTLELSGYWNSLIETTKEQEKEDLSEQVEVEGNIIRSQNPHVASI